MKLQLICSLLLIFIIQIESKNVDWADKFTLNMSSIKITHSYNDKFYNLNENTPLVIWHGMGDTCCNPISLGSLMNFIKEKIPGIYIWSIQIGNSFFEDTMTGFIGNANKQVEHVCDQIRSNTKLQNGFNALGLSQGGQFLRAVVQRCTGIKMNNLITLGGQHQGVYGFPKCPEESAICNYARKLLDMGAYKKFVQENLIQAQYWHDPMDVSVYKENSIFLADINQENAFNATYKKNLMTLNKFVMVKFDLDTMVEPKDSEWFAFYKDGDLKVILPLQQTPLYQKDLLGLKEMDKDNKLVFLKVNTDHLQISDLWFSENVIPYLKSL